MSVPPSQAKLKVFQKGLIKGLSDMNLDFMENAGRSKKYNKEIMKSPAPNNILKAKGKAIAALYAEISRASPEQLHAYFYPSAVLTREQHDFNTKLTPLITAASKATKVHVRHKINYYLTKFTGFLKPTSYNELKNILPPCAAMKQNKSCCSSLLSALPSWPESFSMGFFRKKP